MNQRSSPLYDLLNQINKAAQNGLPLVAIGMAVALPDICVSLADAEGRTNGEKFKAWCAANLSAEYFSFVTPEDLWSMRCGVLHNGRFGDLKESVARIIFALEGPMTFVACKMNDAYVYSVVEFCQNLTNEVHRWYEQVRDDEIVIANAGRLMRFYPSGFPPLIGIPVLA